MMKFSTVLSTVAAAGLALAPIVAQAGTRASVPSVAASSVGSDVGTMGSRRSKPVGDTNDMIGGLNGPAAAAVIASLIAAGILILDGHGKKKSGGTG